uniref:Uncharacterized protein n=1 Tax=Octopus bimaculoides TaxID=37653 RepID=A0A0L8G2L7_OCTBM
MFDRKLYVVKLFSITSAITPTTIIIILLLLPYVTNHFRLKSYQNQLTLYLIHFRC